MAVASIAENRNVISISVVREEAKGLVDRDEMSGDAKMGWVH